jgi:hypothetical protein
VRDKIRFRWQENEWEKPSTCVLGLIKRDGEKCVVVFAHDGLPNARIKEDFRNYWKTTLVRLIELAKAEDKAKVKGARPKAQTTKKLAKRVRK